jgi:hypothetical protein
MLPISTREDRVTIAATPVIRRRGGGEDLGVVAVAISAEDPMGDAD